MFGLMPSVPAFGVPLRNRHVHVMIVSVSRRPADLLLSMVAKMMAKRARRKPGMATSIERKAANLGFWKTVICFWSALIKRRRERYLTLGIEDAITNMSCRKTIAEPVPIRAGVLLVSKWSGHRGSHHGFMAAFCDL